MKFFYPFTTIEGIELFIELLPVVEEPKLYMKIAEKMIAMTVYSHEYELSLDEYFLHIDNLNEHIEYSCPILAELGETRTVGFYKILILRSLFFK